MDILPEGLRSRLKGIRLLMDCLPGCIPELTHASEGWDQQHLREPPNKACIQTCIPSKLPAVQVTVGSLLADV
jgi:hypothetical protein